MLSPLLDFHVLLSKHFKERLCLWTLSGLGLTHCGIWPGLFVVLEPLLELGIASKLMWRAGGPSPQMGEGRRESTSTRRRMTIRTNMRVIRLGVGLVVLAQRRWHHQVEVLLLGRHRDAHGGVGKCRRGSSRRRRWTVGLPFDLVLVEHWPPWVSSQRMTPVQRVGGYKRRR